MTLEHFLIAALATYRITLIVHKEDAPLELAARFRTWAGIKFDQYSNPYSTGQLSAAILCPYCLSVWVGIGVILFIGIMQLIGYPTVAFWILLPFALSGVSAYLFKSAGV